MGLGIERGKAKMGRVNRQLDPTVTGVDAVRLESDLRKRIVGQDDAIEQIINIYQTNLAGMSCPGRPIGNFLSIYNAVPFATGCILSKVSGKG